MMRDDPHGFNHSSYTRSASKSFDSLTPFTMTLQWHCRAIFHRLAAKRACWEVGVAQCKFPIASFGALPLRPLWRHTAERKSNLCIILVIFPLDFDVCSVFRQADLQKSDEEKYTSQCNWPRLYLGAQRKNAGVSCFNCGSGKRGQVPLLVIESNEHCSYVRGIF
jgi:hypothetical protein